jgi:hypothetical protein
MRTYPRNSPQAAARIVALALLADGNLCRSELDRLHALDAHARLGLASADLLSVVHGVCEDLLATSDMYWGGSCRVDEATLAALLGEVTDPALRATVLTLCSEVVHSDTHLSEGESVVLHTAQRLWGLAVPEPA